MPDVEVEGVRIKGFLIEDIMKENFLKEMQKNGIKSNVVGLVFMVENNKKKFLPIILSHQNNKEVEDKIIHLDSQNSTILNKFVELIKRLIKK